MRAGSRHVPAHPGRALVRVSVGRTRLPVWTRSSDWPSPWCAPPGWIWRRFSSAGPGDAGCCGSSWTRSGGVGLDDLALVSRALSAELDAAGIMGETPYTLEVTSPGVDRPLTQPRHWRRAVGRMVSVPLTGGPGGRRHRSGRTAGRTVSGRVIAADDDGVVLDIEGEQRGFGFTELGPGKVQVEFRRDDMGESRGY